MPPPSPNCSGRPPLQNPLRSTGSFRPGLLWREWPDALSVPYPWQVFAALSLGCSDFLLPPGESRKLGSEKTYPGPRADTRDSQPPLRVYANSSPLPVVAALPAGTRDSWLPLPLHPGSESPANSMSISSGHAGFSATVLRTPQNESLASCASIFIGHFGFLATSLRMVQLRCRALSRKVCSSLISPPSRGRPPAAPWCTGSVRPPPGTAPAVPPATAPCAARRAPSAARSG